MLEPEIPMQARAMRAVLLHDEQCVGRRRDVSRWRLRRDLEVPLGPVDADGRVRHAVRTKSMLTSCERGGAAAAPWPARAVDTKPDLAFGTKVPVCWRNRGRASTVHVAVYDICARKGVRRPPLPALLSRLPVLDPESGDVTAVIETPKDSRNKDDYDEGCAAFRLAGVMPEGSSFPYDFGFVPSTLGEDGDPLDVLVLMDKSAYSGDPER